MGTQVIIEIVSKIGLPAAVLFYILIIGSQNQRDMIRSMDGIKNELSNLSVLTHDAIFYMKGKGDK